MDIWRSLLRFLRGRQRLVKKHEETSPAPLTSALNSSVRDRLGAEGEPAPLGWPPGHFYSPIPALEEIRRNEEKIFTMPAQITGVDLRQEEQLRLLDAIQHYYGELPFGDHQQERLRYHFVNDYYSYGEAIILYCMMRHLQPRRIVEIGSGYSSAAILDTNELFFADAISCTFVEPHPERLLSLLKETDKKKATIIQENLQAVDMSLFAELTRNDILFIDSTHVSKINSDVNFIFFGLLPALQEGVCIHFHDIYYPFEYPKKWIYEGRAWNEAYVLRAFLQYNATFEIEFFNSFLAHFHREKFLTMPLFLKNPGSSIWIRKASVSREI
jgi:hypothetical protein